MMVAIVEVGKCYSSIDTLVHGSLSVSLLTLHRERNSRRVHLIRHLTLRACTVPIGL